MGCMPILSLLAVIQQTLLFTNYNPIHLHQQLMLEPMLVFLKILLVIQDLKEQDMISELMSM